MTIYVNDREIKFEQYPNGESIVPGIARHERTNNNVVVVRLHWTGDHDLLHLALVKGLLDQQLGTVTSVYLHIDYMPYSRMDRQQGGHCFSLKYVAAQINNMGWAKIYVVEPHSQVTLDLLKWSAPIWATATLTPLAMRSLGFDHSNDYLVLPDDGAFKRYNNVMSDMLDKCHIVVLKKNRDFDTGKITGIGIDFVLLRGSGDRPAGRRALIVDDLSSRGGTFVAAAELLREKNIATEVSLLVTHMEPAGLEGDLRHVMKRVFCTDTMSFPRPAPPNFEIYQRKDWL